MKFVDKQYTCQIKRQSTTAMAESQEVALCAFLNTFAVAAQRGCLTRLSELSTGSFLASILSELAPSSFDTLEDASASGGEGTDGGNWALSAARLKRIVRALEAYYSEVLGKNVKHVTITIDATRIAKTSDVDEILVLVELVVGVAVMCEDKAKFIPKIFSLDVAAQAVLKGVIEHVMSRVEEGEGDDEEEVEEDEGVSKVAAASPSPSKAAAAVDDKSPHLTEMIRHLQDQNTSLTTKVEQLLRANDEVSAQLHGSKIKLDEFERERRLHDNASLMLQAQAKNVQMALDDTQRELDLKTVAYNGLESQVKQLEQKLESATKTLAKLEMENHQLCDELDVTRDKANKLTKAEAQIFKYQQRLEEVNEIKKENRELVEKLDQYMDKIHNLESSNKNIANMNKMIDQYKDKAVEMEREKFQAVSALQMHQHEHERVLCDLEEALDGKKFLEEELASVRGELEQHLAVAAERRAEEDDLNSSSNNAPSFSNESSDTMASLREKVKLLELEIRSRRHQAKSSENDQEEDNEASSLDGGSAAAALGQVTVLEAELQMALAAKQEREAMLMESKKANSELQAELVKSNRALSELEKTAALATAQKATLRDTEQKLALAENTVRLLETNMKEKEGLLSRLEQDKSKLENFSKSTLLAFKEKYMKALKAINDEKKSLEERLALVTETNEQNQVTARREERLMLSALYEIGVKIMVSRTVLGSSFISF